jgi:hypothetical protein
MLPRILPSLTRIPFKLILKRHPGIISQNTIEKHPAVHAIESPNGIAAELRAEGPSDPAAGSAAAGGQHAARSRDPRSTDRLRGKQNGTFIFFS